jgi:hypothetical protein
LFGNKVDVADNTVTFTVYGEGNVVSGTQPVKSAYVSANSGIAQIKVRSGKVAGTIAVIAESEGLDNSSMTVVTRAGFAKTVVMSATDVTGQPMTSVVADGQNKVRIKTLVKDINDNTVTDYNTNVLFTLKGPGTIITSTSVKPVNGEVETVVHAGVDAGTMTVTVKTGSLSSVIDIYAVAGQRAKFMVNVNPKYVYSLETATITVSVVDENNNLVDPGMPIKLVVESNPSVPDPETEPGITQTVSSGTMLPGGGNTSTQVDHGRFAVVSGTDPVTWSVNNVGFELTTSRANVLYRGSREGQMILSCKSSDLASGRSVDNTITVYPSTTAVSVRIDAPAKVYVPANLSIGLKFVDISNNVITTMNGLTVFTTTDSFGNVLVSSIVPVVNGVSRQNYYIDQPGVYTFKTVTDGLQEKIVRVMAMINKSSDIVVVSRLADYGNVKLEIAKDTIERDIVLEINKGTNLLSQTKIRKSVLPGSIKLLENTAVDLVARDNSGINITGDLGFAPGKYATLTLPYPDINQDGIVDGTTYNESSLRMFRLEPDSTWKILDTGTQYGVDTSLNNIRAQITRFGTYAVMVMGTEPTIENVVVYPNPFEDNTKIAFNIGSACEIKTQVYTIAGRLIKTINTQVSAGNVGYVGIDYDGTDQKENKIANGTYLFKIIAANGAKTYTKTGKLTKIK